MSNNTESRKDALLEKWCVEKRKKSFFKKCTNQALSNQSKNLDKDQLLEKSFTDGLYFTQILIMIKNGEMKIDHQHGETLITVLISACVNGLVDVVESLLRLGANVNLRSSNDLTALEWAKRFGKNDIINLLEGFM